VSRVNVVLPEVNTTVAVELSSRPTANEPWRIVARPDSTVSKRDAEQQNAPLEVRVDDDRYWRARITDSAGPPGNRCACTWNGFQMKSPSSPKDRGRSSWHMGTRRQSEGGDLSQIPATLQISPAVVGPRRCSEIDPACRQAPAFPWIARGTMGVLLLAVALLAWMAYASPTSRCARRNSVLEAREPHIDSASLLRAPDDEKNPPDDRN